jgi:hypothetical protein
MLDFLQVEDCLAAGQDLLEHVTIPQFVRAISKDKWLLWKRNLPVFLHLLFSLVLAISPSILVIQVDVLILAFSALPVVFHALLGKF